MGMILLEHLPPSPNPYTIRELPADEQDHNQDGIPDDVQGLVVVDESTRSFTVTSGSFEADVWLNYIEGSIHGHKFEDVNGNGIFDLPSEDGQVRITFGEADDPGPFQNEENGFIYRTNTGSWDIEDGFG